MVVVLVSFSITFVVAGSTLLLLWYLLDKCFGGVESIAALTSQRTNLSPFTKGCRERGVSMRVSDFFSDLLGPPALGTKSFMHPVSE